MTDRNVVDSSAWLEYLADSDQAAHFAGALEDTDSLIVPVVTIYEVFKKVLRERGENEALQVAGQMQCGTVVDLTLSLALDAARHRLPLADSIIYATALQCGATLWTRDADFEGLPNVRYFPKPRKMPDESA
ncbi:MAG: type II toxin-antitoxin system VapC family toxin [Verrucomicrobiales bacterium]|nr:type II toxin-antitoxin system VapC family toxin [Verrucomicrobiales bacterium]MCP5527878.1 type II toxin-antitoxin system VapC family toxin [Verrucomicrobiales bacterium]